MLTVGTTWRSPRAAASARDAGNRRAQVALDVHRQGLDRRDVEHAAPRVFGRHRREHHAVEARQEGRQRLAAARGREHQRRLAARNRRPALRLWRRRSAERLGEPLFDGGVERHCSDLSPCLVRRAVCLVRCGVQGAWCGAGCSVLLKAMTEAGQLCAPCARRGRAGRRGVRAAACSSVAAPTGRFRHCRSIFVIARRPPHVAPARV